MKKILTLLVILSTLSCSKNDDTEISLLTYESFRDNLHAQMDYSTIVNHFGEPTKDIGSGLHIYVYELSDSTKVLIGHDGGIVVYARHLDKNDKIINVIID
jgi:hypothetical protein